MNQRELNQYVSSLLTMYGIKNRIVREPDDSRLSNYNITTNVGNKSEGKVIVFSTFACSDCADLLTTSYDLNLAESLICCDDDDLFDISLGKYYEKEILYSPDRIIQSKIKGNKDEVIKAMKEEVNFNVENIIKNYLKVETETASV